MSIERKLSRRDFLRLVGVVALGGASMACGGLPGGGSKEKTKKPCEQLTGQDYLDAAVAGDCPCPPKENWGRNESPSGKCAE